MKEASLADIKTAAINAASIGLKWHYHLMSPACSLNMSSDYAIVYEQEAANYRLINYSTRAEMEFSKELATLLHGSKVMSETASDATDSFDARAVAIIELAKRLTEQNIEWHHHVLFPGCAFNPNSPRFTLMLEDPCNEDVLTAVSDAEPKSVLTHIEKLFYRGV